MGRDDSIVWPAFFASLVCFAFNLYLVRRLNYLAGDGADMSPSSSRLGVAGLPPNIFAVVMATGVVSLAAAGAGYRAVAYALFVLNAVVPRAPHPVRCPAGDGLGGGRGGLHRPREGQGSSPWWPGRASSATSSFC